MTDEIRDLLAGDPDPVDLLRAAALGLRSLCEANQAETITLTKADGHSLVYRTGHGLELRHTDEVLCTYPEEALDAEHWGLAA